MSRTILTVVVVCACSAGAAQANDVFNMGPGLTSLTFVTVGDAGNAGYAGETGAVPYTYQMGTYDVTAAQYCQFLNAVATQWDHYGLYNPLMAEGPQHGFEIENTGCGIVKVGNSYEISSSVGFTVNNGNVPVNDISWGDAARFANWLTNGQPTGLEGAGTTETGSYDLNVQRAMQP
jgi:formylglycine-generating enzyme required for sulfatase activity